MRIRNIRPTIAGVVLFCAVATLAFLWPLQSHAVTVGPSKIQVTADPGDTVEGQLFLRNEEDTDQTFYSSIQRFTERGNSKSFLEKPTLLSDWTSLPDEVTLESGEETRLDYTINIPEDAPAGGHFGVIWWSPSPPAGSGTSSDSEQVSITTRAGVLVYLNVTGDVDQSAEITTLSADDSLVGGLPVDFSMSIENSGTTYITPTGTLEVASLLGNTRAEIPINDKNKQILPESSKNLSMKLTGDGWYWGPYKAQATVRYGGDNGQSNVVTKTGWVWVIPPTITIIILVLLLILFIGAPYALRWHSRRVEERLREQGEL